MHVVTDRIRQETLDSSREGAELSRVVTTLTGRKTRPDANPAQHS